MGLATLLRTLGKDNGIEIDDEELASLGLSDDEETSSAEPVSNDILARPIPGHAAGQIELFLDSEIADKFEGIEDKAGLMWYPIIREGMWAVRPGMTGKKRRVPLKVVAGNSKNQRKEIGLKDLVDAFNDDAVQHVTVPSSHNNTVLENQGFIDKMMLVDGTVKDKGTKKDKSVKVLMGGYRITEPDTKGKMQRGTIANRSAGILYDYVNTETGKSYPAVVEHVALTNRPWITGMISFGRKLKEGSADPAPPKEIVGLSLSNEGPGDDEYALMLADEAALEEGDLDFLADQSVTWDQADSPNWLRQQICNTLEYARAEKISTQNKGNPNGLYVDYSVPSYRCVEASNGRALISDGYGDDSNFWIAPYAVTDGQVELSDFAKWQATKKAFVADDRPPPPKDRLPLSEGEQEKVGDKPTQSRLQLAQEWRKSRNSGQGHDNPTPREVVENMSATSESRLELSAEAQAAIQAAEAKAKAAEERAERLAEKLSRTSRTVNESEADKYLAWLASDEGTGLGLSEARGFGGMLAEVRQLMLADDGEPAVQADHFAQDGNSTGELSLTDSLKRVFGAISKSTEGKKRLGEVLSQPAESGEETEEGKETSTTASGDTTPGKPTPGKEGGEELSTEKRKSEILAVSPEISRLTGRKPAEPQPPADQNGGK